MNRQQRRAAKSRERERPTAAPRSFRSSIIPGTAWYWIPVGGVAGVKDAWSPFAALIETMAAHSWMFPAGWLLTIVIHWLIIGPELAAQHDRLTTIRRR